MATHKQRGFTLLELLAIMGIIGILAATALAGLGNYQSRAADKTAQSDARNLLSAAIINSYE